ncbi:MAG TPA: hypothetical protein VHQ70_05670, partial [Syntrophomonadaceae bacterium]|nr:hypothetical protein [Syntrophomonadaceae bacterium]
MRQARYLFLVIGLISVIFMLSGCPGSSNDKAAKKPVKTQQKPAPQAEKAAVSGPVKNVPWAKDRSFKTRQKAAGTPVQMAAFRTVLRDPLPGEEQNVHLAARLLAGIVVKPGQTFSQNNTIGP